MIIKDTYKEDSCLAKAGTRNFLASPHCCQLQRIPKCFRERCLQIVCLCLKQQMFQIRENGTMQVFFIQLQFLDHIARISASNSRYPAVKALTKSICGKVSKKAVGFVYCQYAASNRSAALHKELYQRSTHQILANPEYTGHNTWLPL